VLQLDNVTKRYGGLVAVNGVSARIAAAQTTAIIGPNGAGKTTLFGMIAGAIPPSDGRIIFADHDITRWSADQVCRAGIGRTFQVVRPFWAMTVHDHLRAAAAFGSKAASRSESTVLSDIVTLCGLQDVADRVALTLTLADCRRLEIARALATGARMILLDETMAGLTPEETEQAIQLVKGVVAAGRTVVLIEHVLPAVRGLADRVIVLDRGAVIADGEPIEVLSSATVKKAYLGE